MIFLKNLIRFISLYAILCMPLTYARDMPMNPALKTIILAKELNKTYIEPKRLVGKTVSSAIDIMLEDGYQCGIHPMNENRYLESPATIRCSKIIAAVENDCREFWVSLFADWKGEVRKRSNILQELSNTKVTDFTGNCVVPIRLSTEYLIRRNEAEEALKKYIDSFYLLGGKASKAYETLLSEGFFCDYGREEIGGEPNSTRMLCSRLPSNFKYCYQAKLSMTLLWGNLTSPAIRKANFENATVISVGVTCLIPGMDQPKGQGHAS